jgi:hypothetical protein
VSEADRHLERAGPYAELGAGSHVARSGAVIEVGETTIAVMEVDLKV